MSKKFIGFLAIVSIVLTCLTPFVFNVYLTGMPDHNTISFGGPFPFISKEYLLPQHAKFPLKIDFHLNMLQHSTFHFVSFFLSLIGIFALLLLLSAIVFRFFRNGPRM